jgi:hypothetical protein
MKPEYKPHTRRLKLVDEYIRELFRDELPDGIKFHDANHTLHPNRGVVANANRIALSENISEHDRELLIAAAYFHDTGYIREYKKNEPIAARMAGRILKLIGYKPEKILCDADLDNLGREDFFKLDGKLREGRRARGMDVSDDARWYKETLEIVKKHQYYTESQKKLREKGKQKNIKALLNKLENIAKKKQDRI